MKCRRIAAAAKHRDVGRLAGDQARALVVAALLRDTVVIAECMVGLVQPAY